MAKGERSSPFRIQFERTGGFAGIPLTIEIDSESLKAEQAEELRKLITASDFFNLASMNIEAAGTPDRFIYILTLETEGDRHSVITGEDQITSQLKPLIDYLAGMARRSRSSKASQ